VGSLVAGNKVLTHRGRFRSVTETNFKPYAGTEYKVWIDQGKNKHQPMCVTEEHPFLTSNGWKEAKDIVVGDKLFILTHQCDVCGLQVSYDKRFCLSCGNKQRNSRWLNPSLREEQERKKKSLLLKKEYDVGKRDRRTNISKATEVTRRMYADGALLGFRDPEHLRRCRVLADTPENRAKQSEYMKKYCPMFRPESRKKVSEFMREYCARPDVIERKREIGRRCMESMLLRVPKPDEFTDIEIKMLAEFRKMGLNPVHNKKIGRYFGDFVFEKDGLVVECDGDYWHMRREKERPGYALRRDAYLKDKGYDILHFSGSEIMRNVQRCVDSVSSVLSNHSGKYGFGEVTVVRVECGQLKRRKVAYHFEVDEDHSYVAKGIVHHNCSVLNFRFEDIFAPDMEKAIAFEEQQRMLEEKKKAEAGKELHPSLRPSFPVDSVSAPIAHIPDFVAQNRILQDKIQKNVLVF
jgi:very-short-patch-repair endonuclease